jgi:hypothetical protein
MSEPTTPIKYVTPVNTGHKLFGAIFAVLHEDAEYIYGEIKDAFHWIEARFAKAEVAETNPPVVVEPVAPAAVTAPVVVEATPVTPTNTP